MVLVCMQNCLSLKLTNSLNLVLVCMQNCLSLKLANSLNPEFTLTLQGCYIFAMYNCYSKIGKHHLTFSKRLGRQLISLKILISNS